MTLKERLYQIQEDLDKSPNLYLRGYKRESRFEEWSLKDFIFQLLTKLSETCVTVNELNDEVYCKKSKRRSIGDIYRICKYYYSDVSLFEVQYTLAKLCKENLIGFFYCNHNKSRVYMSRRFYETHTVNPVQYGSPDEYGITPANIKSLSNKDIKDFRIKTLNG